MTVAWLPDAAGLLVTVGDVPSDVWAAGEADAMRADPARLSIHGCSRAGALPRQEEA